MAFFALVVTQKYFIFYCKMICDSSIKISISQVQTGSEMHRDLERKEIKKELFFDLMYLEKNNNTLMKIR